jgi:hypothetical protein
MTIRTRREKRDPSLEQFNFTVIPVQAGIHVIKVMWNSCFRKNQSHRDLRGNLARLFGMGLLVLMFGACASSSTVAPGKGTGPGFVVVPAEKASLFSKPPVDAMLLNEGVSWLGLSDRSADYVKARETFALLINKYPTSEWRPLAETFIHLIDAIQSTLAQNRTEQAKNQSERGLAEKLQQDKEQLKKDLQMLSSKCHADRTSLVQENEQLKRDMKLLKKLEVQLDRREKMLR